MGPVGGAGVGGAGAGVDDDEGGGWPGAPS